MSVSAGSGAPPRRRIARSLAPTLRELGAAMAAASTPDGDFCRTLRRRLLDEASRTPPDGREEPPFRRVLGVTAFGLGIGLAGGGIAALTAQLIANAPAVIAQGGWPPLR